MQCVVLLVVFILCVSASSGLTCGLRQVQDILGSFSDTCSAKFGKALALVATLGELSHSLNKTANSLLVSADTLEVSVVCVIYATLWCCGLIRWRWASVSKK